MIAGAYGYEVPPVPIPNTEVKLIHAEDTQMVTSRENRAAPALIIFISYSSIAQSVERMTVNHDVAGSSPAWGAKQFLTLTIEKGIESDICKSQPSTMVSVVLYGLIVFL